MQQAKKNPFQPGTLMFLLVLLMQLILTPSATQAQNCFANSGCQDYTNYGINSTTAATLEYDNIVTGAGQTIARDANGPCSCAPPAPCPVWAQYKAPGRR